MWIWVSTLRSLSIKPVLAVLGVLRGIKLLLGLLLDRVFSLFGGLLSVLDSFFRGSLTRFLSLFEFGLAHHLSGGFVKELLALFLVGLDHSAQ